MNGVPVSELSVSPSWQSGFLAVLPSVRIRARIRFRYLRAESREEAVQAAIAAACISYQRLARQGKLHGIHASSLADYAVRRVRSGRTVGSRQNSSDLHSPLAKRKHEIRLHSLTSTDQPWDQTLVESRRVLPADRAAFRLDFNQWISGMSQRDRQIITVLASGEATAAVAGRFGLTAGRVSQLRRKYEQDWQTFQGEALGSN